MKLEFITRPGIPNINNKKIIYTKEQFRNAISEYMQNTPEYGRWLYNEYTGSRMMKSNIFSADIKDIVGNINEIDVENYTIDVDFIKPISDIEYKVGLVFIIDPEKENSMKILCFELINPNTYKKKGNDDYESS